MASLNAASINKPIEVLIDPKASLPNADQDVLADALEALVDHSVQHPGEIDQGLHAAMYRVSGIPWLGRLVPGLERLAAEFHIGNFVIMRGTGERFFESMPLYARIGMHLLFYGRLQARLIKTETVERLLREQSTKQGKIYDSPASTAAIPGFIKTYSLQTEELLCPELGHYKTFNEFFHRQLKADARPIQNVEDPNGICSAADCRLVVYPTVQDSTKFWVKGREFNIPNLLNVPPNSKRAKAFEGGSVAVFRLAPSDYHRFHSPIEGTVGEIVNIPGSYYTVNPQAVCQDGVDVLTANVRSVLYMTHRGSGLPVAIVAIGALLVGSIIWTNASEKGKSLARGDELGYFAYGGSTLVVVFPKGLVRYDEDLLEYSREPIETLVKVGYSIGSAITTDEKPRRKKGRIFRQSLQFFQKLGLGSKRHSVQ